MSHPNPERDERVRQIRERRHLMEQFGSLVVSNTPGSHRSFVIVAGTVGLEANCGVDGDRNRAKAEFFANAPSDIDYLLSLLDSQAVERDALRDSASLVAFQSHQIDGQIAESLMENATTRMRNRCVDAIKSLRATPHGAAYNNAINDAIRKVESLTPEGEQEK